MNQKMNNETIENINLNEIVKVETMPTIFYQLEKIGNYIDEELGKVKDLKATDKNKQEVKKIRTGINNTLAKFEDKRKEIKNQILEPYNIFNEKYEQEIKIKLENASMELTGKINEIEEIQKKEKEDKIRLFANEHIKSENLEGIISFENIPIRVNISTTEASLKSEALKFIEKVRDEINLINLEEDFKDEILYEYKNNNFNYIQAKTNVTNRHKKIEVTREILESSNNKVEEDNKVVENVDTLVSAPKEIIEEEIEEVTFTIKATKEQIKKVIKFLRSEGINYD